MAWRDILKGSGWDDALNALNNGRGYQGIWDALRNTFPDENPRELRVVAGRIEEAWEAAKRIRTGKWDAVPDPAGFPTLFGVRPPEGYKEDCKVRYDLSVQIVDPETGHKSWRNLGTVDSNKSLTFRELREEAKRMFDDYLGVRVTLQGGAGRGDPYVINVKVNFAWRC